MGLSAGLVSPEGPVVSGGSTGGAVDDIYELRLRIKDATPSGPPPMVGADGIEPSTSSVSRKRSTTEPRAYSEAKPEGYQRDGRVSTIRPAQSLEVRPHGDRLGMRRAERPIEDARRA